MERVRNCRRKGRRSWRKMVRPGRREEKMDRGEVKEGGSDEAVRSREDNAHTGKKRRKAKWVDRD